MLDNKTLVRYYLQDLIKDIRAARRQAKERHELKDYEQHCIELFRELWPFRHTATIDQWGMPTIQEEEPPLFI